jgi:hypothetical protein
LDDAAAAAAPFVVVVVVATGVGLKRPLAGVELPRPGAASWFCVVVEGFSQVASPVFRCKK